MQSNAFRNAEHLCHDNLSSPRGTSLDLRDYRRCGYREELFRFDDLRPLELSGAAKDLSIRPSNRRWPSLSFALHRYCPKNWPSHQLARWSGTVRAPRVEPALARRARCRRQACARPRGGQRGGGEQASTGAVNARLLEGTAGRC